MCAAALVWFRFDLRLADNPALAAAAARGGRVLPVFIWAPEEEGEWPPGAASRWWLHQSLRSLDAALRRLGAHLVLRRGPSLDALRSPVRESGADAVFWNRRYEPALYARDVRVQKALLSYGLSVRTFNSALLLEPEEIGNRSGKPFRVFTPFWRTCLSAIPGFMPAAAPTFTKARPLSSLPLDELGLEPVVDWAKGLRAAWRPGEAGAQSMLQRFLDNALADYPEGRDRPADIGTSRLSPHLHFGEISPSVCGLHVPSTAMLHPRHFSANWPGASLPITCFVISLTPAVRRCVRSSRGFHGNKMIADSRHGNAAAQGTRLSMPACESCGLPDGCTTGCARSLVRFL